jgi:hypothetical protein
MQIYCLPFEVFVLSPLVDLSYMLCLTSVMLRIEGFRCLIPSNGSDFKNKEGNRSASTIAGFFSTEIHRICV